VDDRVKDDPWPFILMELDAAWAEVRAELQSLAANGFVNAAEARYRNGERLYEKEWLDWPLERFEDEAMQELVDLVLYKAMRRVKYPQGLA
jgi:hypothetical protein